MNIGDLILIAIAFSLGGVLKGASGAGAPLLAVPVMAMLRDVPFAVAVFVLPNIVPNLIQFFQYRKGLTSMRYAWGFAVAGGIGAALGTIALAEWHSDILTIGVAVLLVIYIAFRLARPGWALARPLAERIGLPIGVMAGALQGATGISAPITLSYLNAMKMPRSEFVPMVSLFFLFMGIFQLPAQMSLGIMTTERLLFSAIALLPLLAGMPLGAWIGRKVGSEVFDRIILAILGALAVKLFWDALG